VSKANYLTRPPVKARSSSVVTAQERSQAEEFVPDEQLYHGALACEGVSHAPKRQCREVET
jgi:hypothetical protein